MIEQTALYRSRVTARAAHPEPHSRLTSAVISAEAFAAARGNIELDVELTARIVDIAEDTMRALVFRSETTRVDIANARRVLVAARRVAKRAAADAPHLDSLVQRADDLAELINKLEVGELAEQVHHVG